MHAVESPQGFFLEALGFLILCLVSFQQALNLRLRVQPLPSVQVQSQVLLLGVQPLPSVQVQAQNLLLGVQPLPSVQVQAQNLLLGVQPLAQVSQTIYSDSLS